jgi:hypothetical protein
VFSFSFSVLVPGDGGSQVQARINRKSTLHYICYNGSEGIVGIAEILVAANPLTASWKNTRNSTPLQLACSQPNYNPRLVKMLIEAAPNAVDADSLFKICSRGDPDPEIVKMMIEANKGIVMKHDEDKHQNALHIVCQGSRPSVDIARQLVSVSSKVAFAQDFQGNTPLHTLLAHYISSEIPAKFQRAKNGQRENTETPASKESRMHNQQEVAKFSIGKHPKLLLIQGGASQVSPLELLVQQKFPLQVIGYNSLRDFAKYLYELVGKNKDSATGFQALYSILSGMGELGILEEFKAIDQVPFEIVKSSKVTCLQKALRRKDDVASKKILFWSSSYSVYR